MNKKLFLSALFVGSTVVNGCAGFRNLDQLTEFADEIIYNPDITMEDHLTIDALRNLDTETLVEAMDIIREAYLTDVQKTVYKTCRTKVNKINFLIFNAVVASEPSLRTIVSRLEYPLDTLIYAIIDNEFVIDFFKNPDNLSEIHENDIITLINSLKYRQYRMENDNFIKTNVDRDTVETLIQTITESAYPVLSECYARKGKITFYNNSLDSSNTTCHLLDIYGERGLDFITERSISDLDPHNLIAFAVKMKGLHSPKADDFYNNIIKNKLKTITAENLSNFIKEKTHLIINTSQGLSDAINDIIPNFSLKELTSIVDKLSAPRLGHTPFVPEIKDIISQQINAKKEEFAT